MVQQRFHKKRLKVYKVTLLNCNIITYIYFKQEIITK